MVFSWQNGTLYCEGLSLVAIREQVGHTPFYLYSANQIRENFNAYKNAVRGLPAVISYALKANGNIHILDIIRLMGGWATLVSGNELHLALAAGFDPRHTIFNGNGKTIQELNLAIEHDSLINIDSIFDLDHIQQAADRAGKSVEVLLRINPNINPRVHPFLATGLQNSKFGVHHEGVLEILKRLKEVPSINLVGVHCHLGSTIYDVDVFRQAMQMMVKHFETIRKAGFSAKYINLGGGLGIDYRKTGDTIPTPNDIVSVTRNLIPEKATLILEPGRSIIGNAGVLISSVIGVKRTVNKNFIVIDSSMTELIRPSLYKAYHHIAYIEPVDGEIDTFDIVGPVCESADFLGKDRSLPEPPEGTGVVVFDAGAYGFAMSSNYNARLRPPEYLVDKDQLILIRRAETLEDQLRLFDS